MSYMTSEQVAEARRRLGNRQRVPLREVLEPFGIDAPKRSRLLREGLVQEAEGKRAPKNAVLVERDQAEQLIEAAAIACAAGAALITVLRIIRLLGG